MIYILDENDTTIRNQNYMDYFNAEDEDSLISHSPVNELDIKPFSQDNKSLLVLALDSMTNVIIFIYSLILKKYLIKQLHNDYV